MRILIYPTHKTYSRWTHADMAKHTHGWLHSHYEELTSEKAIPTKGKLLAYIIDAVSLKIKDVLEFEEYEFKHDIDYDDKSYIVAVRQPNADADDYVLCQCEGTTIFVGIFKEYESQSNSHEYKLIMLQKEKLFDRLVFVSNESIISKTGIEDFIADTITQNWISSGDSKLDKSYITVEAMTHTKVYSKVSTVTSLADGCFNLKTYLGNALEYYGIKVEFDITAASLTIYIYKDDADIYQVSALDTDIAEYSETYAVDALTKLLVRYDQKESGSSEVTASTNYEYFLLNDRTITTDKDAENRAQGSTRSMVIEAESEDEMYQKVQDAFSGNSYSHKISFNLYMDSRIYDYISLYIGRSCRVRTKSGTRTSLVTATTVKSGSRFTTVEMGKLKVTLIDKIRSAK